ncbi:MAG: N-hydroxyarylamine O-acetyltransferase [Cyclobacteriaceae bacterium]|jgi:N-hydroxyarylamine O-acetyltransferase
MSRKLNYFKTRSKVKSINVSPYLERLGLSIGLHDIAFLKKIHKAHLLHIPFENLDIHYGKKIILDINQIYKKIILEKRGGFCYELNGLIYHLLSNLGYECSLISARVKRNEGWGAAFDHMLVMVELNNEKWLVDVGYGSLFVEPKKLVLNTPQLDYNNYYKFETDVDENWILKKSRDNSVYSTIYRFDLQAHELIEFLPMCNYHQESDKSTFTQNKLITQLFSNGRITLTDRKLKIELDGILNEKPIMNEDEFLSKLEHHFGIDSRKLIMSRFE